LSITRRHFAHKNPWQSAELADYLGVSSLENFIDKFVRAGILLRSADPEGVALARPPEAVTIKDILDIVDDSTQDDKSTGPAGDILQRRDQAVQTALDGITLKSLVAENRSTIIRFPRSGSGT
jgi:DNA-binding IscR family transcriptional regulator